MDNHNSSNSVAHSILELIGGTPLLRLSNLTEGAPCADIWAKLENLNPAGSIKERICLGMIEAAEREGIISPGQNCIVGPTSGNTGIGLALVCAVKGYRLILTMPDDMSQERKDLLGAYGAELILTPAGENMEGAIARAEEIVSQTPDSYMPQQFKNEVNPDTHSETTAAEIIEQTPGSVDAFVAGVGTGGTITGVGRVLKKKYPGILLVAVEPEESAVLSDGKRGLHEIQGMGFGFVPDVLDTAIYDEVITVSSREAREFTREIALREGLLVGISSGAAGYAARKTAQKLGRGKQVVTVFADTGERYLSTELFG